MFDPHIILKDFRYALRQLARKPGFTATVALTLALGIGATTAVFSVMNAIMLRYLPVPHPQQLVMLHITAQPEGSDQTGYDETTSLPEQAFEEFRMQPDIFSDLVGFVPLGDANSKIAVRFGKDTEEAAVDEVSGNFFSGLGVKIVRGRSFELADEKTHAQLGILSYRYWTRRFGRDPSVLNQIFYIKGVPFTAIGVAAPDFVGLERDKATDLWVPFQVNPNLKPWAASAHDPANFYGSPKWFFLMAIGRLKSNVSLERALAQLGPVYTSVVRQSIGEPKPNAQRSDLSLVPMRGIEGARERFHEPLTVLMVMVALVLLIACSNVAMLMLVRNSGRQQEFSLRMALGAGRSPLFRQLLIESLLLVSAGGALGWILAVVATRLLALWSDLEVSLAPDRQVLFFAMGVCALAVIVFALVPLRSVAGVPEGLSLRGTMGVIAQARRRFGLRHIIVTLQVSLCLILLVSAGLMVRTLRNLENANLGFRASGLVVFGIAPPESATGDAGVIHFHSALLDRLRTLPQVESATLMQNRIGSGWSGNSSILVDSVIPDGRQFTSIRWNAVGPDYFHVLDIPVLLGRDFRTSDAGSSPPVAVINQTFAKVYLNGRDAVGHRIAFSDTANKQYTVVGMVGDSRYTSVREESQPMAYFPFTQVPGINTMHFELRTLGNSDGLLSEIRKAIKEFGPDLSMLQPMTQQQQLDRSLGDERLSARLSVLFGLLAGALVATGLYGALSYQVHRRIPEIGLRMALGAQRSQVLWMVLRGSLRVSSAGVLFGLPFAMIAARLLRTMLFGLPLIDPVTFISAVVLVFLVTLIASALPVGRAVSVQPMAALRYQ